jgi:hypothetical protein
MDDFQRAAAAAQGRYTQEEWMALPPREQAQAIYAALRRIDAERVAAATALPRRRPTSCSGGSAPIELTVVAHAD